MLECLNKTGLRSHHLVSKHVNKLLSKNSMNLVFKLGINIKTKNTFVFSFTYLIG